MLHYLYFLLVSIIISSLKYGGVLPSLKYSFVWGIGALLPSLPIYCYKYMYYKSKVTTSKIDRHMPRRIRSPFRSGISPAMQYLSVHLPKLSAASPASLASLQDLRSGGLSIRRASAKVSRNWVSELHRLRSIKKDFIRTFSNVMRVNAHSWIENVQNILLTEITCEICQHFGVQHAQRGCWEPQVFFLFISNASATRPREWSQGGRAESNSYFSLLCNSPPRSLILHKIIHST